MMEWLTEFLTCQFCLISLLVGLLIFYGTSTYNHWKNLGVIYMKPRYPIFGNSFDTTFSLQSTVEDQKTKYDFFEGSRFGGIFSFRKPVLFLRDPELIETILIKDFTHFYNRGAELDPELELFSHNLFHLKGAQWKNLRNKLTPTFTSGKLKGMHQQLLDCSEEVVSYIKQYTIGKPFEVREVMSKFATDVIASCAFGLNVNSINSDSEFRNIGRQVFKSTFLSRIRRAIRNNFPALLKLLRWRNIPVSMHDYFVNTIKSTIEYREKNNIQRLDFLHLMNELKKQDMRLLQEGKIEKQFVFDDQLLAANAFVFFIAGFETTASTLSFALCELAVNEDIQEKAYQEVLASYKKHGNELTFEALKKINYLDEIISETLRKYPPVTETTRKVTVPYEIPDSSLFLDKNSTVLIPIYSIQHDPQNYPNPEKFIPERFSEENKENIKKGTYLPFGDGPRMCIGPRFAKLEIKVTLSKILMNYKLRMCEKTSYPLKFNRKSNFLRPINGIWINIKERQNSY